MFQAHLPSGRHIDGNHKLIGYRHPVVFIPPLPSSKKKLCANINKIAKNDLFAAEFLRSCQKAVFARQ